MKLAPHRIIKGLPTQKRFSVYKYSKWYVLWLVTSFPSHCRVLNGTEGGYEVAYILDGSVNKGSTCNAGDPSSIPGSGRSPGEGIGCPLQYSWASLVAQMIKNLPSVQDWGLIPALERSLGEGNGYPLQYSGLENSMDRGAWQATRGVTKSQTQLSNLHFLSGSWSSTLQSCSSNHCDCLPYLLLDRNSGLNTLSFAQKPESCLVMDYLYWKASSKEAATLLIEMFSY